MKKSQSDTVSDKMAVLENYSWYTSLQSTLCLKKNRTPITF